MEERIGPLTFFSNFDSGNLAKVERKQDDDSEEENANVPIIVPDYEYNIWTWPDAVETEFENLNRTWFHFGVKGGPPGKLLKINIMNLNRQGKLYSQGMSPFVKVVPGRNRWDRIRDRPTYQTVDGQFHLSFTYRFPEQRNSVHYFAFCYPYSYSELQTHLQYLDKTYESCKTTTPLSPNTSIYYHRELLCKSLDDLRLDLLTITSYKGLVKERETRLDKLFPDVDTPRAHRFKGKKVYFLSARVHPGETPSSFVFNGFLDFLLRQDDPRAIALCDQYVFKLIPMLNPDGVKRGHYRTDSRGVNLNRVYLDPDPVLHPTIYAAKSVIMYHHNKMDHQTKNRVCICSGNTSNPRQDTQDTSGTSDTSGTQKLVDNVTGLTLNEDDIKELGKRLPAEGVDNIKEASRVPDDTITVISAGLPDFENSANEMKNTTNSNPDDKLGNMDTLDKPKLNDIADDKLQKRNGENKLEEKTKEVTEVPKNKLCNCLAEDGTKISGDLVFYVDLHGHASKRGCFVYANYMENEDDYVQSILYPKLMSLNSANFDFTGCNFTERNMYTKDKRDGMSKEGSGRVAVFKATSIVHSYTLECNYNGGRMLNPIPPATCDRGRATPPPPPGFPPKFTTEIFEEVGRALAVAVLDINNSNPWSRLPTSEFGSVEGVKNWVQRFVKSTKNAPSLPKKLSRAVVKTSSIVAGATASTRQKYCSTFKSTSSSDLSSESLSAAAQKITERMTQNINAPKKVLDDPKVAKRIIAAPRRLSQTIAGLPTNKPSVTRKITPGCNVDNQPLTATSASLKTQMFKNKERKEQSRLSLDLPKTGLALRIPKPNRLLSASIKALSCPGDLRTGSRSNQVEVHNQFVGLQPRKITVVRPGGGSASDEEKRKKIFLNKKRNGKKKGKPDDQINGLPACPTDTKPQKSSEVDASSKAIKKVPGAGRKGESTRSLLHRSNSRNKKLINSSLNSCEIVDITELPQSSSQALAYWVDA